MQLCKIKSEDLIFTNAIEDDRTNTYLTLHDSDWKNYRLRTRFVTENMGILDIEFEYIGAATSTMRVMQKINNHTETVNYQYASDIFIKYLIRFLEAHLEQWNTDHVFNNEDIVIDFYNEVLETGVIETPFNISL